MAIRNAYLGGAPMMIFSGETCEHCGDDEVRAQGFHQLELLSDIGGPSALIKDYVKWSNPVKSRDVLAAPVLRDRLETCRAKHDALLARREADALAGKDSRPIASRWFLNVAQKTLPADAIILDETILHTRFVHQYLAEPGRYIKSAYGGLGVGLGESLGVKLAGPDRPVILMVGDGAFNYNPVLADLGLSQEYGLPVFIIILNNGGYLAMKFSHQRLYPKGWAATRDRFLGVDITPSPDYVKIAEAFGAYGEKLEDPAEIEAALKRGLQQTAGGKTALLDVVLEHSSPFMPPPRPAGN